VNAKVKMCACVLLACTAAAILLHSMPRACAATIAQAGAALPAPQANPAAQPAGASGFVSEWQGRLATLRLIVPIAQTSDGHLTAKLTSVDQGNVTIAADAVSITASAEIQIEFKSIGATFKAKLSPDGGELAGTWQQGGNSIPLTLHRPGAAPVKFTLSPKTIGKISFQPCRTPDGNTEGLCGKYQVYENRASQAGRRISLNIMVLPAIAAAPAADPFFAFAGGPGQSAVEAYTLTGFTVRLRQNHDVVLIDQRGTGGSNPLACDVRDPNDAQQIIGEEYPVDRLHTCRAELEKHADLTQYTTSIAVDDVDEVRQALGYGKIDIFGGSYGTRAALEYLRRHGDQVRTITLEGVVPPNYRIPVSFARTTQQSIDKIIALCAADEECRAGFPDLGTEFNTLLSRLDKTPAQVAVKNPGNQTQTVTLTRGVFVAALRPMLYFPQIISEFPFVVQRAWAGDWSLYAQNALLIRGAVDKTIDRPMALSVICSEDIPGLTQAIIRRETKNTFLGDSQVRVLETACREWPQGSVPADFHTPVHSSVPALLLSGALDPATPPEVSAHMAHDLPNSLVVVVKNGTHGTGSPCLDGLIAKFVDNGSATGLDTSCVSQITLPPFLTQKQVDALQQKSAEKK
jgi:pimeloyl-ACP methyl ester carboxylesterase